LKITLPKLLIIVLLTIGSFFIFKNLANIYLWYDEASTAVFGRTILNFGYPRVFDGVNWQDPELIKSIGTDSYYIEKYHVWLPYYIAAASLKLFGQTTWAARMPFAIIGFFCLILTIRLTRRWFPNRRYLGIVALSLLVFSVPFLLHIRQCRYYAPQIFFTILSFITYDRYLKKSSWSRLLLFCGILFLLFFSNHGVFIPVFGTLGLFSITIDRSKWTFKRILFVAVLSASYAIPWYLYGNAAYHARFNLEHVWDNLQFFIRTINKYLLPLAFYGIVIGWYTLRRNFFFLKWDKNEINKFLRILIFFLVSTIFFMLQAQRSIRYFIHLLPFLFIIQAAVFESWFRVRKAWPALFLILLLFTNALSRPFPLLVLAPFKPKVVKDVDLQSYPLKFVDEIFHDYDGPVEAICRYLKEHSNEGETVKINYGDLSVMFYVPWLKVENGYFFAKHDFPEWVVWRDYWIKKELRDKKSRSESIEVDEQYLEEIKQKYEAIELSAVDLIWENRPDDLGYHKFRTVTEGDKVVIYRRKDLAQQ